MDIKYQMNHNYRGRALVIGNQFKGQGTTERKGCKKDVKMMKELFSRLDFMVTVRYNLKAKEMENILKRFAGHSPVDTSERTGSEGDTKNHEDCQRIKKQNRESDCFVCVISTHGEEIRESRQTGLPAEADVWRHAVLGNDKDRVYVDQIINIFTDKNAPELAGKPKLFFLQACRSRGSDDRLVRISNPKYDHGFYVRTVTETAKDRDYKTLLFKKVRDKIFKKKKPVSRQELLIYQDDIAGRRDTLYANWDKEPGDADDAIDATSEDENCSTDQSDEDDDDEQGSEDDISSEDDETSDEDEEDARKYVDEEDAKMNKDILRPPSAIPHRPPSPPIQELLPPTPFDVVPLTCPDDFLIMYPVMSGKSAMRSPTGSYLLKYMHKGDNVSKLIEGRDLLQYITCVIQDTAGYEFQPDLKMKSKSKPERRKKLQMWVDSSIKTLSSDKALLATVLSKQHQGCIAKDEALIEQYLKENVESFTNKEMRRILKKVLPFKTAAIVVHRLRGNVCFSPKSPESPMAKVKEALSKQ